MCTGLLSTAGRPQAPASSPRAFNLSDLLAVSASGGQEGKTGHSYPAVARIFDSAWQGAGLTAFEENRVFVYAAGKVRPGAAGALWRRRLIYLKPSAFLIDDELIESDADAPPRWRLNFSPYEAKILKGQVRINAGQQEIICETLYPSRTEIKLSRAPASPGNLLEVTAPRARRFLHLITLDASAPAGGRILLAENDRLNLEFSRRGLIYRLGLPPAAQDAGEIKVTNTSGKTLVAARPLPSGIMPHTPKGIRLLEIWDGDYRDGRHPKWDTGRPSAELRKAVEEGIIPPGRVVEFGCGTGTDAIYMARHGFEVTAIDIAPSAIAQALAKARKAGVSVRFLLADALNPPEIGKFDFIYDRACYHEVRGQNLNAYLDTLRKASRPGTRMLLLAGNATGPELGFGPPTVTEEELRFDFLPLFEIEWLRVSHFEVNQPAAGLPLAWSALMRRRQD